MAVKQLACPMNLAQPGMPTPGQLWEAEHRHAAVTCTSRKGLVLFRLAASGFLFTRLVMEADCTSVVINS